ncbi:MAG: PhnD/SsuA/transferrin family substrate-binding protein [Nostocaceae cyanobacterium]|nr:PhnD/SsuA/transferrin family substrate-binding protein [Nostocaceae cyanobacterium]
MSRLFSRRMFILQLLSLTMSGCQSSPKHEGKLIVGVLNYGGRGEIINQYAKFNRYLGEKTKSNIQLEPAFNENKAIERLSERAWSLVFAPPGLAAIAIADYQYTPLFPLPGTSNLRTARSAKLSLLIVRQDNPIRNLKQLEGKTIALGEPGSATGYYLPLYNLYGLTLAAIEFAPTPSSVLELVAQGKVAAGAVSMAEFNLYSPRSRARLRILHTDPHYVPPGLVLIGPDVERTRQEYIRKVMSEYPATASQEIGYVPNAQVPDYRYMMAVVERVKPLASRLQSHPVRLF